MAVLLRQYETSDWRPNSQLLSAVSVDDNLPLASDGVRPVDSHAEQVDQYRLFI